MALDRTEIDAMIDEKPLIELYIDLWGLSHPWIRAIQAKILDMAESDETAESYSCDACMAIRFQTPSRERAEIVKKAFRRLMNLAGKTFQGPREKIWYSPPGY